MQHTEKYQFNLIEGSDSFLPEPLNDNASKTEAALEAHAARLDALPRIHIQRWTGTDATTKTISFPFQPQIVFLTILQADSAGATLIAYGQQRCKRDNGTYDTALRWTETSVTFSGNGASLSILAFNQKDRPYLAVAVS